MAKSLSQEMNTAEINDARAKIASKRLKKINNDVFTLLSCEWKRYIIRPVVTAFLPLEIRVATRASCFKTNIFQDGGRKGTLVMPFFRPFHALNLAKRCITFEIVNFNAELKEQLRSWLRLVKAKKSRDFMVKKCLTSQLCSHRTLFSYPPSLP